MANAQTRLADFTYVEVEGVRRNPEQVSPAVTIIESEAIKRHGVVTLADLLRTSAGIDVVRSGGSGQNSSVFIRGADSKHTLVLIDGMEANDGGAPNRGFDFSSLSSENIERIEIIKGSQSVRFGSDAIGGVVNVITKKGDGPLTLSYFGEAGEYETVKGAGGVSGSEGLFNYSLGASSVRAGGPSSAASSLGNGEYDAAQRLSLSSRLGWRISEDASADLTLRSFESYNEVDSNGGPGGDDPNYDTSQRQLLMGGTVKTRWLQKRLDSSIFVGRSIVRRNYNNRSDPVHTDDYHERFDTQSTKLETRHTYTLNDGGDIEFAVQHREESSDSQGSFNLTPQAQQRRHQTLLGESLAYDLIQNPWLLGAGIRHDSSDNEDSILSFSLQPGIKIEQLATTLRWGYSTGFKLPSLYQLYSSYGDPKLKTEQSTAWELSAETRFATASGITVSYFRNEYKNLIDYQSSKYLNVGAAYSRGVEVQLDALMTKTWELRPSYTFLETRDLSTGLSLQRRPKNRLAIESVFHFEPWEVSLQWTGTGTREDTDPSTNKRIRMPFYDVVDVRADYSWFRSLRIGGRIENLFNRGYEETSGYGTSRMAGYLNLSGEL